jgi:hypothetical protein
VVSDREERLEEALWRIAQWAEAYPLEVFPEPDQDYWSKAADVLRANGMAIDRISAACMRHVILRVGQIAKDALENAHDA